MTDSTKQPCAYAEGAYGHAGCGECIECERLSNAMLRTMLHRIARYWTEDEGATPRATRMQRAIDRIPAMLGGTSAPDLAPSARMAARSRCRLDGADAQALEGALRQSEMETCRVSDAYVEATREIDRLRAENDRLRAGRLRAETVIAARECLSVAWRDSVWGTKRIAELSDAIADLGRCYPPEEE